jgi:hypothetical protein
MTWPTPISWATRTWLSGLGLRPPLGFFTASVENPSGSGLPWVSVFSQALLDRTDRLGGAEDPPA